MYKYPKIVSLFQRNKETFRVEPLLRKDDSIVVLSNQTNIRLEEKVDGSSGQLEYCNNAWGEFIDYYSRNNKIEDCNACGGLSVEEHTDTKKLTYTKAKLIDCKKCKGRGYIDIMFIRETLEKAINLKLLRKWHKENFKRDKDGASVTVKIFGEVVGEKIQKNIYTPKGVRAFRVFDFQIGNSWLNPLNRNGICEKLELKPVPQITTLFQFPSYEECYDMLTRTYNKSLLAKEYGRDEQLEGYILRPQISTYTNHGRVMGKIKLTDYLTKKEYFEKRRDKK